jgi:hypothetical protein
MCLSPCFASVCPAPLVILPPALAGTELAEATKVMTHIPPHTHVETYIESYIESYIYIYIYIYILC